MAASGPPQPAALITGITGYAGSRLAQRLLGEGFAVHGATRDLSRRARLGAAGDRVTLHACDGTTEGWIRLVAEARPAVVFHLAGCFVAPHTPADVLPLLGANVVLGTQLLEAMSVNRVDHLVNVGTWWQHYQDEAYHPAALYAATRQAFQDIVEFYARATPLRAITLKLFDTYGEDDPRPRLFSLLQRALRDGQPLAMSSGEQVVDCVHIDDVLEAFIVAMRRLAAGRVAGHERYAVSTRAALRVKDVARMFEEAGGAHLPILWGARADRPREMTGPCAGGAWLPGWTPQVGLAEGIRRVLAGGVGHPPVAAKRERGNFGDCD